MDTMNMYGGAMNPAGQYNQNNGAGYPYQAYQTQQQSQSQFQQAQQNGYTQNMVQNPQDYPQSNDYNQSLNKIPHPVEFWARETSDTVFFVEDNLKAPAANEYFGAGGNQLLMTLHSNFSKFKFNIYKSKEKKFLAFNINPSQIAGLENQLQAIYLSEITQPLKSADTNESQLEPCYTVLFTGGYFKGKTPAEAILGAMQDNTLEQAFQAIEKQRQFLLNNLAKYPRNQIQIDAVNSAYALYNAGQLIPKDTSQAVSKIVILDEFKVPNAKTVDQEGLTKVSAFKIYYVKGEKYPITFEITNARAMATIHENSTTTASMNTAKDIEKASFNMTLSDFSDMISELKNQKQIFEERIREERRKIAITEAARQRQMNQNR